MRRSFNAGIFVLALASIFAAGISCFAGTIELFTGEKYTGPIVLDTAITITPASGPAQKLDFSQILRMTLRDDAKVDESVQPGVVLRNGVRVAGPVGAIGEAVVPVGRRELKVPGPEIAWVVYDPIPAAEVTKVPAGKLGAVLPGGDFFEAKLRAIDGATIKLTSPVFGPRNFSPVRHDILALVLREMHPAPIPYEVRLTDGSLLQAETLVVDKNDLVLRGGFLDGNRVELKDVTEIRAGPARYQPIATITPARVTPPLGVAPEAALVADQTLGGAAFSLPDRTIQHYLDVTVGATPVWTVPAGMTLFNAGIAVSPKVPSNVRLVFTVYADGKQVFRSTPMTVADPPQTIHATLGAARSIALRVEPHFPTNATGSGIWLDPTLLRR